MRTAAFLTALLVACGGVDAPNAIQVMQPISPYATTETKPDEVSVFFNVYEPPHPSDGMRHEVAVEYAGIAMFDSGVSSNLLINGFDSTANDRFSLSLNLSSNIATGVYRFRIGTEAQDFNARVDYKALNAWYAGSCSQMDTQSECYGSGELTIFDTGERLVGEIDITFSHHAPLGRHLENGVVVKEYGDVIGRLIVTFDFAN